MEYFMVRSNPDYDDAPRLREIDNSLNADHFRFDQSYNMPMRMTVPIMPNEHMDFTDYLFQSVPLFSDEAMKVILRFDDDFIRKEVILYSPEDGMNHLYHLPFFPRFPSDVIRAPGSPSALRNADTVPDLVIPYTLPAFFVVWESRTFLFMRLDLTESLLRNGARGLMLYKTIVREGEV
jgi:hypothetical protein